jgi:hypothetical protein
MILGHIAIAGIAKRKFLAENFTFLLAASYGPDLVDKTLNLACGASGRGVGHSLLMLALLTAAGWLYCQRFRINKKLLYIGLILWSSHLITDLLELKIFLWPFLGPLPFYPNYTFMERLRNFYVLHTHPVQLYLEISFTMIAMILWICYSLRSRIRSPA